MYLHAPGGVVLYFVGCKLYMDNEKKHSKRATSLSGCAVLVRLCSLSHQHEISWFCYLFRSAMNDFLSICCLQNEDSYQESRATCRANYPQKRDVIIDLPLSSQIHEQCH